VCRGRVGVAMERGVRRKPNTSYLTPLGHCLRGGLEWLFACVRQHPLPSPHPAGETTNTHSLYSCFGFLGRIVGAGETNRFWTPPPWSVMWYLWCWWGGPPTPPGVFVGSCCVSPPPFGGTPHLFFAPGCLEKQNRCHHLSPPPVQKWKWEHPT